MLQHFRPGFFRRLQFPGLRLGAGEHLPFLRHNCTFCHRRGRAGLSEPLAKATSFHPLQGHLLRRGSEPGVTFPKENAGAGLQKGIVQFLCITKQTQPWSVWLRSFAVGTEHTGLALKAKTILGPSWRCGVLAAGHLCYDLHRQYRTPLATAVSWHVLWCKNSSTNIYLAASGRNKVASPSKNISQMDCG